MQKYEENATFCNNVDKFLYALKKKGRKACHSLQKTNSRHSGIMILQAKRSLSFCRLVRL